MSRNTEPHNASLPEGKLPPAPTGNASNPSDQQEPTVPEAANQLLGERAEKYLRESASIEDMPDVQDWQDADKRLGKNDAGDKATA